MRLRVQQLQQVEAGAAHYRAPYRQAGGAVVGYRGAVEHPADQLVVNRVHAVQDGDFPRRHAPGEVLQHAAHGLFGLRLPIGAGKNSARRLPSTRGRGSVQNLQPQAAFAQPADGFGGEGECLAVRVPGQEKPCRQRPRQRFEHAELQRVDVVDAIDQDLLSARRGELHGRCHLRRRGRGRLRRARGGIRERRQHRLVCPRHRRQRAQPRPPRCACHQPRVDRALAQIADGGGHGVHHAGIGQRVRAVAAGTGVVLHDYLFQQRDVGAVGKRQGGAGAGCRRGASWQRQFGRQIHERQETDVRYRVKRTRQQAAQIDVLQVRAHHHQHRRRRVVRLRRMYGTHELPLQFGNIAAHQHRRAAMCRHVGPGRRRHSARALLSHGWPRRSGLPGARRRRRRWRRIRVPPDRRRRTEYRPRSACGRLRRHAPRRRSCAPAPGRRPKWAAPEAARSVALNGAWCRTRCNSPVNQSKLTVPW